MRNVNGKKITLVTETCYPQINGVSRIVDRLSRRLTQKGWAIQLLSPNYSTSGQETENGIESCTFRSIRFPPYPEIRLPIAPFLGVTKALRSFDPGVVHILTEGPLGLTVLKTSKKLNIPIVTSYHTNFPAYMKHYKIPWLEPAAWAYLRWFHNSAKVTLAPTEEVVNMLHDKEFEGVRAWGHGVDSNQFHPDNRSKDRRRSLGAGPEDTLFLYVGRVAPEKNVQTLIDAFRQLPAHEKVRLMVVGDGPVRKKIASIEDPRIGTLGFQEPEALSEIYASADVFVFPSLTDTFGLVVLEAMASGLPVTAFDVTGPKASIADEYNGLLAGMTDAESLGEIMLRTHRDPDLRHRLSIGARKHTEANDWDRIMDRSIHIYEDLMNNCAHQRKPGQDRSQTSREMPIHMNANTRNQTPDSTP